MWVTIGSSTLFFAFFFIDIDKNDIRADLDHAPPWNKKFKIPPEKPA